jgi:hypothetical protein
MGTGNFKGRIEVLRREGIAIKDAPNLIVFVFFLE